MRRIPRIWNKYMLLQEKGRSENKGIIYGFLTVVAMADICRIGRSLDIDIQYV